MNGEASQIFLITVYLTKNKFTNNQLIICRVERTCRVWKTENVELKVQVSHLDMRDLCTVKGEKPNRDGALMSYQG